MANLKQLSDNVARAMRQSKFPVPKQERMTPLVASIQSLIDREVEVASAEKILKAAPKPKEVDLSPVIRSVDSLRESIAKKEVAKVSIDAKEIGTAVAKELEKVMPKPEKAHKKSAPLSYYATIERNSRGDMVGVKLDPVAEKKE